MKKLTAIHEEGWTRQALIKDDRDVDYLVELCRAQGFIRFQITTVHELVNPEITELSLPGVALN